MKTYRVFLISRTIDIQADHVDYDPVMSARINFVDKKGEGLGMFFADDIQGYVDTAALASLEDLSV